MGTYSIDDDPTPPYGTPVSSNVDPGHSSHLRVDDFSSENFVFCTGCGIVMHKDWYDTHSANHCAAMKTESDNYIGHCYICLMPVVEDHKKFNNGVLTHRSCK